MKNLFLIVLMTPAAFASGDFSISVNHGIEKEWIRVQPEGKIWKCGSNTVPMEESPGNPLKNLDWSALESEAKVMPKHCQDTVKINNDLKGPGKTVTTCLSQPSTKALYNNLSGNCKTEI